MDVGAWSYAENLIQGLPMYFAVSQPSIAMSLAQLIHIAMAPVHDKYSGLNSKIRTKKYDKLNNNDRQAHSFEEFKEIVMPMLVTLGPYAYHDSVLLYKVSNEIVKAPFIQIYFRQDNKTRLYISAVPKMVPAAAQVNPDKV